MDDGSDALFFQIGQKPVTLFAADYILMPYTCGMFCQYRKLYQWIFQMAGIGVCDRNAFLGDLVQMLQPDP